MKPVGPPPLDLHAALLACEICNATYAYPPGSTRVGQAEALGFSAVQFDGPCVTGIVASHEEARIQVIAFEGSHDRRDWCSNFNCPLVRRGPYPGLVHEGFADALEPVVDELLGCLRVKDGWRRIIAGHSRGGPFATFMHWRARQANLAGCASVTFGAPACGDWIFAGTVSKWLDQTRFVFDADPVPHVLQSPYHHACPPWFIGDDNALSFDPPVYQQVESWARFELARFRHRWEPLWAELASQHLLPSSYLPAMEILLARSAKGAAE